MSDVADFLAALDRWSPRVDELLLDPALMNRVAPVHLREVVRAYLARGGKRLRPAVLLLACGAVGGREEDVLPAAAALELFHTWTLIHDDIIDHDDMRRGGPSGHALGAQLGARDLGLVGADSLDYGISLAMLAGDVQHGLCVTLFLRTRNVDPALLAHLVADLELNVVCDLVEGETLDVQLEDMPLDEVSLDDVLRMLYLKTGVLYEFAGKAGAMLGLGTLEEGHPYVSALREFCANCGIAFQLQDDILGIVGDQQKLGKPVGSDILEGKRTPVLLKACEAAGPADRAVLDAVVGNPSAAPEDVARATQVMVRLGAVDAVAAMARERIDAAYSALARLPQSRYTRWLGGWAQYMIEREF